jgi:hypothetical protein
MAPFKVDLLAPYSGSGDLAAQGLSHLIFAREGVFVLAEARPWKNLKLTAGDSYEHDGNSGWRRTVTFEVVRVAPGVGVDLDAIAVLIESVDECADAGCAGEDGAPLLVGRAPITSMQLPARRFYTPLMAGRAVLRLTGIGAELLGRSPTPPCRS